MTDRRPRRLHRSWVASALGLALVAGFPAAAGAEDTVAFRIDIDEVTESSGLARDVGGGYYWTVDDSAGGRVFGVRPDGRLRGTLNFRAEPRDVEAVAKAGSRLYIADIGDNEASRDMVTVYWIENADANGLTVTYNAWDFRYPDGAHDAETLLVDPDGRLSVVTKGAQGGVYRAPAEPSRQGVNELERVGDAPALVTDGLYLPDGDQIALLTYSAVVVVDAETYAEVARATIPSQPQAESLALDLEGTSLLVGSEGKNSAVFQVAIPGVDETPTPDPAVPAEEDSGDAGVDETGLVPAEESSSRATLAVVGLAALVAVVAGVVVAVVRRPG